MKRIQFLLCILVIFAGISACNLLQKEAPEQKEETKDSAAVEAAAPEEAGTIGEGLTEDEAKTLLREEKVLAGTEVGSGNRETELVRIQEEITADIEGREPDFEKAGLKPELKPLVAKETFSADKASSPTAYERDMAVMRYIREYVKQKKEKEAASATDDGKSSDAGAKDAQ